MENRNITTKIIVCSYDELNEKEKKLIDAAKEATGLIRPTLAFK